MVLLETTHFHFFKEFICVIFNYVYVSVYMWLYASEDRYLRKPEAAGPPGAGVSGSCKLPSWVLQTYLRSPERTVHALQHRAITPEGLSPHILSLWELRETRHSSSLTHSTDS